jgi:hypothetical protein
VLTREVELWIGKALEQKRIELNKECFAPGVVANEIHTTGAN